MFFFYSFCQLFSQKIGGGLLKSLAAQEKRTGHTFETICLFLSKKVTIYQINTLPGPSFSKIFSSVRAVPQASGGRSVSR